MPKSRGYCLLLLISLFLLLGAPASGQAPQGPAELPPLLDQDLLRELDQESRAVFQVKGFMGMSVAVLKEGQVAYLNYGLTEEGGAKIDEHTPFEIASLTKTFTGTLLADLVLEGLLGLDTPLGQFFPGAKASELNGVAVTLKHLATHTSGLPRDGVYLNTLNPFADFSRADLETFLAFNSPSTTPGTVYNYSNLAMGTLGEILADAAGVGYGQLLQTRILDKLGLAATTLEWDEALLARKAQPHLASGTPARPWDFDVLRAAGGLKSTTRDLARFLAANLESLEVDQALAQAMALTQETHFSGQRTLGLAWHVGRQPCGRVFDHNGLVGGYCSTMIICPEKKIGVVVLVNNAGSVDSLAYGLLAKLAQ